MPDIPDIPVRLRRAPATAAGCLGLVAAIALASCSGGSSQRPPEIVLDRTTCAHCGMLVSDRVFAAAARFPRDGGREEAAVFDDIACLLAAGRPASGTVFWFHDGLSGEWIEGTTATFVRFASLQTPMGGGMLAYRSAAEAERVAREQDGVVVGGLEHLFGDVSAGARP